MPSEMALRGSGSGWKSCSRAPVRSSTTPIAAATCTRWPRPNTAADAARASHWLEATLARLFCGEGSGVVWGLQRMQPLSEEAGEAIGTALTYLQKRLHQVDFGSHRKGGYPIGSGAIESAHRFIGHVRLKRSGAWWYKENSNAILALRCALYNGTLDGVFQQYREKPENNHRNRNNQLRHPLATLHDGCVKTRLHP